MFKKAMLALLVGLSLTTTPTAQAEIRFVYSPLQVGVALIAGGTFTGASLYSTYNELAALYYAVVRSEINQQEEAYNNKQTRTHVATGFKSKLVAFAAGVIGAVAMIPSIVSTSPNYLP